MAKSAILAKQPQGRARQPRVLMLHEKNGGSSEAIHLTAQARMDCFFASAPHNDGAPIL
jgi:hypothetical protein